MTREIPKRRFYRTLFSDNPRLLTAILGFNQAWHDRKARARMAAMDLPPQLAGCLQSSPRLGLGKGEAPGFWDFEEESRRIILVASAPLKQGIEYWGAAFCAPAIRSVVSKPDRLLLEQKIGSQLAAYALGRGGFYLGEAKNQISVSGFDPIDHAPDQLRRCGIRALAMVAGGWPAALRQAAAEKIQALYPNAGYAQLMEASQSVDPARQRMLWGVLKNIFLREVAPEWAPCFS